MEACWKVVARLIALILGNGESSGRDLGFWQTPTVMLVWSHVSRPSFEHVSLHHCHFI